MEKTKIRLSPDELLLMQNTDWILTKNSVIEKICEGFGDLIIRMQQKLDAGQPLIDDRIILFSPKISKGEKYQGLPYVILDYPRVFGKNDIIAIRTLFWWGHFCSITLHVKGSSQELIINRLIAAAEPGSNRDYYVSFCGDEWNHDLLKDDYKKFQSFTKQDIENIQKATFVKIAAKVAIADWDIMQEELMDLYFSMVELIKV